MKKDVTIFAPGDVLKNRYRVVELLGQGNFGQIFQVEDLACRSWKKVLKVPMDDYYKAQELFRREAEVLQLYCCPGIPNVEREGYFTVQSKENKPLPCLVMEYIDGENLHKWLEKNQPLTENLALHWLKQLIDILGQLHEQNYCHRDIKPSNIMLKPDGHLALIDFGAIAKVSNTYLTNQMSGTYPGTQIGSPGYWAPEQCDGQALPESDFFALGRTFVHLLTGQHPLSFRKDRNNGRTIWRGSAPQVSRELADLIDQMMAPFPGQRPDRAHSLFRLKMLFKNCG